MVKFHRLGIALVLLWIAAAGPAIAADRQFEPMPTPQQTLRYEKGKALLFVQTSRASLVLSYDPNGRNAGLFSVAIMNVSDSPFTVGDESVSATTDGQPLHLSTYSERVASLKRSQMWSKIGASLAAGANSMAASNAGTTTYQGNYRGNFRAPGANATVNGTYSGTAYDAGAAASAQQEANQRNQAMVAQVNRNAASDNASLESGAFQKQTIDPGRIATGDFLIALPKRGSGGNLSIQFTIEGEVVTATFQEAR